MGYAAGNNRVMAKTFADGADYVWLLNNDAQTDRDTLDHLVRVAQADPRIGMVSPLLYRRHGSDEIDAAAAIFDIDTLSVSVTQSIEAARTWQQEKPHNIALYGTALLIKKSVHDAVGGFDEIFFAYNEDVDISIRSANAGFLNVVDFGSRVYHRERPRVGVDQDTVAPHVHYYMTRNNIILWNKYGGSRPVSKQRFGS
jgi:hypothetical protein